MTNKASSFNILRYFSFYVLSREKKKNEKPDKEAMMKKLNMLK